MPIKVEMLIQVCINGRPIWRKAKTMKSEMTYQMTDREYDKVLDAGIGELGVQVKEARAKVSVKDKVLTAK